MGEWQKDPAALQGYDDIVYLIAMTENCDSQPATGDELADWQSELDFSAVTMTDPARELFSSYADANGCESGGGVGGPGCSNALSVLIDRDMRVRYFGSTYTCGTGGGSQCGETPNIPPETSECLQESLDEILALLQE